MARRNGELRRVAEGHRGPGYGRGSFGKLPGSSPSVLGGTAVGRHPLLQLFPFHQEVQQDEPVPDQIWPGMAIGLAVLLRQTCEGSKIPGAIDFREVIAITKIERDVDRGRRAGRGGRSDHAGNGGRHRFAEVPRHPLGGIGFDSIDVPNQCHEVIEGIRIVQAARMDQAHE